MTYRLTESDSAHADVARFGLENLQTVESYVRSLAANPRHQFRIDRRREGVADVVVLHATDRTISLHILPPDDICRERLAAADAMPAGYEMVDGATQPRHATGQHCDCDECTAPDPNGRTCIDCQALIEGSESPDANRCADCYQIECQRMETAPPNAAPAPQCADCTVDLVMANTSWLDPQLCRQCSGTRRRAA